MLVLITNSCHMNCPHCLQNAEPCDEFMSFNTFKRTVEFAKYIEAPIITISGGEPTEHSDLFMFCKYLNSLNYPFSIVSNGEWYKNEETFSSVLEILNLQSCLPMQVYSNKRYYKEFDGTVKFFSSFSHPKVIFTTGEIRSMQDLGRAHFNCQSEIVQNKYHMSCLVATLHAHQSSDWKSFSHNLTLNSNFCKPSIDINGEIHLSESRLCPSFGSVFDSFDDSWHKVSKAIPCGKCALSKKFETSSDPKMKLCKKIIYGY